MKKRPLLLIVLALVALATVAPTADGETAAPAPGTALSGGITFDHASIVDPVRLDGEPDIAIAPDGSIYVSGPGSSAQQRSDFWKSEDGGVHWHNIGVVPDMKDNGGLGGGDTELAVDSKGGVWGMDQEGLVCNAMFHSADGGKNFSYSQGCEPGTDRPWMFTYTDKTGKVTAYFAANGEGLGCYFLSSTDGTTWTNPNSGGVTGGPGGSCIGRGVVDQRNGDIYIPTGSGIRKSTDGGKTWATTGNSGASGGAGTAGFGTLQIDAEGNLYQVWTELSKQIDVGVSRDGGKTWTKSAIKVPGLKSYIFGWPVVGDPGRLAVAFYGTPTPNDQTAAWRTYISFSTNALDATPTYQTALADEHVMHVGTVCLQGTACAASATSVNGDRTLADFFMLDRDPRDGRVFIVYNDDGDQSPVTQKGQSYVAVIRERTGPSLLASVGSVAPPTTGDVAITSATSSGAVGGTAGLPAGNWATDQAGDAVVNWTGNGPNVPALDIREASVSEAGGNLTFTMKLADLSAIPQANTTQGAPSWVVSWWEQARNADGTLGLQSHYFAKWLGGTNFVYGKTSAVDMPQLGAPAPKVVLYTPSGTANGSVSGNTVTLTVPLASLGNLKAGDKIDNVTAWTWSERGEFPAVIDQTKSFSYVVGTPAAGQHALDGYVQVSVDDPTFANAVIAELTPANTWTAQLPSLASGTHTIYARQVLSSALYNPTAWDDVAVGPVATTAVAA
ncbi:MAG: hypothetical protein ABR600_14005 [Actinomycetota bacterium]